MVSVNGGLCNVILKINDKALNLELTKGMSVAQVLADHKITLNDSDFINVSESDMIYDGMNIVVKKSISVTVEADGKKAYISLFGGTVQDALRAAGIEVNKDDLVNQPLKNDITEDMKIKVSRVTYKERTEEEEIAFDREEIEDDSMYVGEESVTTEGVKGSQKVVYRDQYVDGK